MSCPKRQLHKKCESERKLNAPASSKNVYEDIKYKRTNKLKASQNRPKFEHLITSFKSQI